uniref:Unconventional myosin-XVIIIa n=1 Tax=Lepeophtheirus salmonis TaxID=72036 RepID=A0A0K2UGM7_LEPSM
MDRGNFLNRVNGVITNPSVHSINSNSLSMPKFESSYSKTSLYNSDTRGFRSKSSSNSSISSSGYHSIERKPKVPPSVPEDREYGSVHINSSNNSLSTRHQPTSKLLTKSIKDFITRTDHSAQEWKSLGRASSVVPESSSSIKKQAAPIARASSVAPRPIPQNSNRDSIRSSRAASSTRFLSLEDECNWILSGREPLPSDGDDDSDTLDDISGDELSEMTADLAEEHSTATLATERLEVEQTERMKLAKERDDLSTTNKRLLGTNARMETELLYSRAVDLNGLPGFDDVDEDGEPSFYKQKYERAMKELELAKKRLQQQHEDDLEQLMAVKKQLEKKLYDAYEEVDEQRNIVAQWKRKTQKAQGESNDFKHLYEEQSSRNVLLEKKQRKFDAEIASLIEENKKEIVSKEKLQREIDNIKNVKYSLEDQVHALKLDLEFKDEKINALNKELEELHNGGAVEEEIASLKKHKAELDARLMDQEEELDDLAGQVQMLEQSKIKLEMSIAAQKKEHRKELSSKEEELEDARAAAQKRVKALEQQLENEHEERMGFVREKHDLETKIMNLQELASRSTDEEYVIKLKKDLKKTKALLKDAQCMIDKSRNDSSNKIVLRQLKNQLEDAEFAKTAAVKCRQNTEMELTEVQQQLDDVMRSKNDLEDKMMRICREKSDAQTQLEDNEEELSDIMKKYKSAVSQLSVDQITITQQTQQITELEEERHRLKETLSELNQKIDNLESDNISSVTHSRLELKIRELESKLELEQATRGRMETQIGRLKEAIEKYNHECDILRNKELNSQDMARKLQRQLRDSKEDYASLAQKEMETNAKKFEYEKQLELSESEVITVKNDLKIALKRIEHLQTAMQGDLSSETDSVSDGESDMSDDGVDVFLEHHRRAVSVQRERESMARELSAQRELRASMVREMSLKPLETMSEHPEETH